MVDPTPAADVEGLRANRDQILAEKKGLQEKLSVLERAAAAAGIDPSDPGAFLTKREAESRARQDRETRVKDATLQALISVGTPVAPTIVQALVRSAVESGSITLAEDGSVSGASAHVAEWLGHLKGPAPIAHRPDAPPRMPQLSTMAAPPAGPENFMALVKQGPAAVTAFASAQPERYAALRLAHEQGIAQPRGGHPAR